MAADCGDFARVCGGVANVATEAKASKREAAILWRRNPGIRERRLS
jgi:hypothetical protein